MILLLLRSAFAAPVACLSLGILVGVASGRPPTASTTKICTATWGRAPYDVAVIKSRKLVSCKAAKRVVADFMARGGGQGKVHTSHGWNCTWRAPGGPASTCTKGRRLIVFLTD